MTPLKALQHKAYSDSWLLFCPIRLEIIDYLAEEPSEWGISCIGSRGISGFLDAALLATPHPQTGETLASAIARMGGKPQALEKRDDIAAAFELHIEQGQVLEAGGIAVGIVSGIVGIIRLEIVLHGQANHAGTTPMPLRHDALTAAAEIILAAETLAQEMAARGAGYVVATCGQIFATPNASNVIAGETRLVFDIRSDQRALMLHFLVWRYGDVTVLMGWPKWPMWVMASAIWNFAVLVQTVMTARQTTRLLAPRELPPVNHVETL